MKLMRMVISLVLISHTAAFCAQEHNKKNEEWSKRLLNTMIVAVTEPEDPALGTLHQRVVCRLYSKLQMHEKGIFNTTLQSSGYAVENDTYHATDDELDRYVHAPKAITYNACLLCEAYGEIDTTYFS